ncbi:hypothetical protein KM043_011326 [Ampulex compressa]|nr:hypothetical protein KM043_011326 [Ampulex compressa]
MRTGRREMEEKEEHKLVGGNKALGKTVRNHERGGKEGIHHSSFQCSATIGGGTGRMGAAPRNRGGKTLGKEVAQKGERCTPGVCSGRERGR